MTVQQKNIPALRFPEFEGEWTQIKLGDKCNFQQGIQIDLEKQELFPKDGFIKFLRIENYTQNSTDFRYIPEEMAGTKRINSDEVAIVRYGASAGFVSRGYDGVLANNLFKVIPDKEIINSFLFIILSSYKSNSFFQSQMAGGAMPALSFGIVKNLELAYPIIPEQQKIADFLTAVDERIQQLSRKKELLEQYKKGVMQQLFSQQIRFKDEQGNDYPEWEEKRLGDVGESFIGLTYSPENVVKSGGTLVLRSSNIQNGRLAFEDNVYVSGDIPDSCKVKEDDILICARNGSRALIGKSALIAKEHKGFAFGAFMSVYRSDCNNFIFQLLQSPIFFRQVNEHLGATINQITSKSLNSFKFYFPANSEQKLIANFLSSVDDKISSVQVEIEQTQLFKKGLLQQMFV